MVEVGVVRMERKMDNALAIVIPSGGSSSPMHAKPEVVKEVLTAATLKLGKAPVACRRAGLRASAANRWVTRPTSCYVRSHNAVKYL